MKGLDVNALQAETERVSLSEQQVTKGNARGINDTADMYMEQDMMYFSCSQWISRSAQDMVNGIKKDLRKLVQEIDDTQWMYPSIDKLLGM